MAIYLGEGQVIDTDVFRNVGIHSLDDFQRWDILRYENLSDGQLRRIINYLTVRFSAPYDHFQIAGFFLESLLGLRNNWQMKNKYTCGSLIDRAFSYAGIDLVPLKTEGDTTPEDLYRSRLLSEVL